MRLETDPNIYEFCLYVHRRADNNQIFYVGIGSIERPFAFPKKLKIGKGTVGKRNIIWLNIARKHGVIVDVLWKGLKWWQAECLEIFMIAEHGRIDNHTGTLANCTNGGDGFMKGNIPWNKGKKWSNTTKAKMSASHIGIPTWNKGKIGCYSDEYRSKISKANIGKKRTIEQIDKMSQRLIGRVCTEKTRNKIKKANLGKARTDEQKKRISLAHIGIRTSEWQEKINEGVRRTIHNRYKKIYQYSKNGEFIKEWESLESIQNELKIHKSNVSAVCHKRIKTYKNFVWSFKKNSNS